MHILFPLAILFLVFSAGWTTYDCGRMSGAKTLYDKGFHDGKSNAKEESPKEYQRGYKDGFNDRSLGREKQFH